MNLECYTVTPTESLKLPKKFPEALEDALRKIDAHAAELQLSHVFLFGSAARGEALFGSDLDLLLLTTAPTEREFRLKVIEYDIDDDVAYVPIQVTVRKTARFVDPESDVCGFNATITRDLILLRRYNDGSI